MPATKRRRPASSKAPTSSKTASTKAPATPAKTFEIGTGDSKRGKKFVIYGGSGIGKTTLAVMAPKPVLIPLDDGSADIRDPFTNELIKQVKDCYTFEDCRAAMHQYSLFNDHETVIIDTATKLQDLSHVYMFKTIPHEKGHTVKSIEAYGYGKGYSHLYDTMKLVLQDADELVRRGKNVIFICQCIARSIPNAAGDDYLCNVPRLYPGSKNLPSVEALYTEWADHVLFIDHANKIVTDKKIKGDVTRAVFTQGELHFKAKSRVLANGGTVPTVVSFDGVDDESIFTYIFEGVDDAENKPAMPDCPSEE